ncbi:hypothetical protein [Paenibacillus cremeus]|uniref:Uncharacterized protein n=1 Tax=Paenibacillus cremeus TaxID=2163881 RepID=A0A559KCK7_9BACL|nr:hypothetical protein [Paenibacillus cremeus]TVY09819.1 hypothetical protein FPZ49_10615 [Paenibacillus cremeus]
MQTLKGRPRKNATQPKQQRWYLQYITSDNTPLQMVFRGEESLNTYIKEQNIHKTHIKYLSTNKFPWRQHYSLNNSTSEFVSAIGSNGNKTTKRMGGN